MSASASLDRGLIVHGNSLGCLTTSHVTILLYTAGGEKRSRPKKREKKEGGKEAKGKKEATHVASPDW